MGDRNNYRLTFGLFIVLKRRVTAIHGRGTVFLVDLDRFRVASLEF